MPRKKPLANKSQLHRATKIDRATITKRLDDAGVKPKATKKGGKEVIYDAEEALKVLASPGRSGEKSGREKRENIQAARELLKYKREKGELVDRPAALDEQTRIFKWVIKELTFRRRRAIVVEARKARTQKEAEVTFTQNVLEVFNDLRENYRDRGVADA